MFVTSAAAAAAAAAASTIFLPYIECTIILCIDMAFRP